MKYLPALVAILVVFSLPSCKEDDIVPPGKPELASPENASTSITLSPTFNWNPVREAKTFGFQLSSTYDFTNTEESLNDIDDTSLTVQNLKPNTKYYWRVNAKNSAGISEWSDIWEFTTEPVGIPTLVAPENNSVLGENQANLEWNSIPDADGYSIQVSLKQDFSNTVFNQENINTTSIQVDNLECFSTYYWRVKATINLCDSEWSDAWSFTTQMNETPILNSPTDNSITNNNQITLAWGSISKAETYNIQVSSSSDFSSLIINQENHPTSIFNTAELTWNLKHYWRVRASINDCYSDWSETRVFTTKRLIPTIGLVAYYPFNGNANDESGNSHNGTPMGVELSNDRNNNTNKAYSFDGVDDYISIPHNDNLNLIGDYTISAWYNSDGCSAPCGTYHTIINKRDVSTGPNDDWPWGLAISYINGPDNQFKKVVSSRRTNSNLDYGVSESEILLNTWQHVAIVVHNGFQSIYLNGEFQGTHTFVQSQSANSKDMIIGWSLRPGLEQFKGLIDDIRLYSRALTVEEVIALFEE